MNRIILIGNGFDLAHGMPTGYRDFIDDYWQKIINDVMKCLENKFENDSIKIDHVPFMNQPKSFEELESEVKNSTGIIFKNYFLKHITKKVFVENWVDIEYYQLLKKISVEGVTINYTEYNVGKLNADFEKIKKYLKAYLDKIQSKRISKNKNILKRNLYSKLNINELNDSGINRIVELILEGKQYYDLNKELYDWVSKSYFFEKSDRNERFNEIRKKLVSGIDQVFKGYQLESTLFLNFNYTNTESLYEREYNSLYKSRSIHIHGELEKHDFNPIIFGYGDEIDESYKDIEKLNDNKYLENIKSIKYLQTSNYKKLLNHIESDYYQVFIMGHSCGISDRTLLNTLFEHDHCVSIKPYYHQIDDENDNYEDIIMNISRNFTDKVKMRDRVVNKEYCEPLT